MPAAKLPRLIWSISALLIAASCWRAAPAAAETAIHFTLDRRIDGASAPFFVAIDRGYFQAEGLDVAIVPTAGPLEPIKRLASGNYDMGVADINVLIKFRDANPDTALKAVFVIQDKAPYAVVSRKSRGVTMPKDLEGKKLGAPSAEGTFAQWPIFARLNGIDAAKVTIENVGLPVREPMLAAGEVDAVTSYSFVSPVDLKDAGVPADDIVVLLMADYGLELYGPSIVVTPEFAAAKPDAVRGFLRAYVRALQDTLRDPARAIDSVLRRNDALRKDVEVERLRIVLHDNIAAPPHPLDGYGGIDRTRFAAALDQLAMAYPFKARDKAADVFDPSFLPGAAER
jgi:NitT/TauT family transport system substrate-binding protein